MQCTSITSYDECYTPAHWNFPNITRPFSIIYYVLGGTAFYTFDDTERPLKKDHLYIFPINKQFSLREDPHDKLYSVYIHAFTSPEIDSVIEIDVSCDAFVSDTLCMIRRYIRHENSIYIQKLTDMLLSYVSETAETIAEQIPEQIKIYIDSNYISIFKRSDLSRHFNYSSSYLTKVFKEKYNLTPRRYAQQLILKEITLLIDRGYSVAEIAEKLQFSSPENLSRFFRRCYGYPPTEYLKRFRDFPI